MVEIRYVSEPGTNLLHTAGGAVKKELLLGARVHVDPANTQNGFVHATLMRRSDADVARTGFLDESRLSPTQQLKVFYVDVGQGDATLIEAEGAVVVIDGGPYSRFFDHLEQRLAHIRQADADAGLPRRDRLMINALIISHFDTDHYQGAIKLLESDDFEFGTIYHQGLVRYGDGANKDLDLGDRVDEPDGTASLSTDLDDLASARALAATADFRTATGKDNTFLKFLKAAFKADDEGRLSAMTRLVRRDPSGPAPVLPGLGADMTLELLAPLSTELAGAVRLRAFPDPHDVSVTNPQPSPTDSHTLNGNSIVLRLRHGSQRFLFGGDLNQPSQLYLRARYGDMTPFEAEVNKACHHGSSDFDLGYLQAVAPLATVFSSGDDKNYDHPLPDAMGAAARHGRGDYPLVFSTELVREVSASGKVNLYGHINARCNGTTVVMAQRKEKPTLRTDWIPYRLPYAGPFGGH
jgi:beta-lactamase superfamily II metal-dependent hydrolase